MRINEIGSVRPPSITKEIMRNCRQIVQLYISQTDAFFYRGAKRSDSSYKSVTIDDRKPRDTDRFTHDRMTTAMKETGLKAHRGNSIFVTSKFDIARGYAEEPRPNKPKEGKVYMIFPVDGFAYSWSPKVYDLYGAMLDGRIDLELDDTYGGSDADNFIRQVKKLGYKSTDLEKALRLNCEVMIKGRYYGINASRKKDITAFIRGLK